MSTNVGDRNAGLAAPQAQVWGFDARTGIDSRNYFAPGAKIFYVDQNNTLAVDAGNLGEDPSVPLATVAAAVALVRPYQGDTIILGANDDWQYAAGLRNTSIAETLVIPATTGGFRIVGTGTNPLGVIWEPVVADDFCITVNACDVLIEGIGFTGSNGVAGNGIYVDWDGTTVYGENVTIRNCFFDDGIDIAIQLEFSWYGQIYNNWFAECDEYGIYTDGGGSGCGYCDIHSNRFVNCGTAAIALLGSANDNDVHHNHIYNSSALSGAAATNEGINTTGGARNLVHHNTLSCLLPVPAAGDFDDFCNAAATDAWSQNYLLDGPSVTNPV